MEAIIAGLTSAIFGHVEGRSSSWWTGKNSLIGKLTGGGSDRPGSTGTTIRTPRGDSNISPLILIAVAYLVFGK